jgi:hypothetical protein
MRFLCSTKISMVWTLLFFFSAGAAILIVTTWERISITINAKKDVAVEQGDQIRRIFAYRTDVYFGQFFENCSNYLAFFFPQYNLCINNVDKKMGWATFWATFLQAHLVTVPRIQYNSRILHTEVRTLGFCMLRLQCFTYVHMYVHTYMLWAFFAMAACSI